jgi:uncharacterized membrane protein
MYHYVIGSSILKNIKPFIRKNVLQSITSYDFLFINTMFISIIYFIVFLYKSFYDKKCETIKCVKNLNTKQIIFFIVLAGLTVFASILSLEYEKNSDNLIVVDNIFMKMVSAVVLLCISRFIFNESLTMKQSFGVFAILFGLFLIKK